MQPNPERIHVFIERFLADVTGAAAVAQAALGDRLGLFGALAESGPVTAADLAARTSLSERYLTEWLGGMTAAGYLAYDADARTFALPAEHASVLADEGGPAFLGAVPDLVLGCTSVLDRLAGAFRSGGGIGPGEFPPEVLRSQDRLAARYEHQLAGWLERTPDLADRLARGATLLDAGCGGGRAALAVAKAFPEARIHGVDRFAPAIERARLHAARQGLGDRVSFEVRDACDLPHEAYDVVLALDVVHDAADPLGVLVSLRNALRPDGAALVLEPDGCPHVEENINQIGRFRYAQSLFYCLTVSLAEGGAGLGACAGEAALRALTARAGFTRFERLAIDDPFDALFRLER